MAVIAIVLSGAGVPGTTAAGPPVTAPGAEPEIGVPATPSDKRALVVGDSLAEGVEPHLGDFLPGWRIATSAYTGRPTSDGVSEIVGRGSLPPVLVVSLGTNDDPSAVAAFEGSI